ncbi:DUF4190 domain-containing protein [Nocardia yamanashiensis]|uniref:DUF4190 domain-containing protein n=1 Tax=Nocardia yamanashiensis TaxID=209247 RepID=UPI001E2A327E|nr:DUF4190 domain-containing protein [Nocardia yamanashiensis]UGT44273.1 DUF4190 domain-containing protein [Nocardia yamanashiensis]
MTTHQHHAPATTPRKTSLLAAATLLTGFFGFCCIPLLLGPVALLHVKQTGEKGRGMAITGMLASLAWIAALTVLAQ